MLPESQLKDRTYDVSTCPGYLLNTFKQCTWFVIKAWVEGHCCQASVAPVCTEQGYQQYSSCAVDMTAASLKECNIMTRKNAIATPD